MSAKYLQTIINASPTILLLALTTVIQATSPAAVDAQTKARILVGPNVLVSRMGDGNSWEHFVAANPTNASNLLGTGILNRTKHTGGIPGETRAYVSRDGGYSWRTVIFPEFAAARSGDPLVAYGRSGTAFFIALSVLDKKIGMFVWRSEDGGVTWSKPKYVYQLDHPQIIVDHSNGRFAGNVYVNAMFLDNPNYKEGEILDYHVGLFRSTDDGRSWIGPVTVATNHTRPERGFQAHQPVLFTNGDLMATFASWAMSEDARKKAVQERQPSYEYGLAISSDGGGSFSSQQKILTKEGHAIMGSTAPFFAADGSEGPHRDRVYIAYADRNVDFEAGKLFYRDLQSDDKPSRVYLSYSSDKGKTWAKPRMIAPIERGDQFDVSIAVNNEGTIAVSYHDTRDTPAGYKGVLINRYISISTDGGESFLPAVKLSSEPSDPEILHRNLTGATVMQTNVSFQTGETDYGDYQGIATDVNGNFHPFWSDGRTGRNQAWTARVQLERSEIGLTQTSEATRQLKLTSPN